MSLLITRSARVETAESTGNPRLVKALDCQLTLKKSGKASTVSTLSGKEV